MIQNFLSDKLQINGIDIKVAHRTGVGDFRPIVVELENKMDKGVILKKKAKLKSHRNEAGKKYFINEQLPEVLSEKRRHDNALIWENKQKLVSNQASMSFKNGELQINGTQYKSKIKPPTVRKILALTGEEGEMLRKINLAVSETFNEKGSAFTGVASIAL